MCSKAVAAAWTRIERRDLKAAQQGPLCEYLRKYAGRVQDLLLRQSPMHRLALLSLPWESLKQLKVLVLKRVALDKVDRVRLTELEQLQLHRCSLHSRSCLLQLTASTKLTSFELGLSWQLSSSDDVDCSQVLQHLLLLVKLKLVGDALPVTTTTMQHIAAMQRLQNLELMGDLNVITSGPLPTSITRLVYGVDVTPTPTADLPPAVLQQLSSLQQLWLHEICLSGRAFGSAQQLQELTLRSCSLSAEALNSLTGLTRLQSLCLWGPALQVAQPQQLSALTASPQLTRLDIEYPNFSAPLLPGMVRHMFAAARGQQLQCLVLSGLRVCVGTEDLAAIARSCPHLCALDLAGAVLPDTDLSCLKQLTACSDLTLGGAAITDHVAASGIAQLTGLQTLSLHSCPLTHMGLAALTTLTRLRDFTVTGPERVTVTGLQRGLLYLHSYGRNVSGCVWSEASRRAAVSDQCIVKFYIVHRRIACSSAASGTDCWDKSLRFNILLNDYISMLPCRHLSISRSSKWLQGSGMGRTWRQDWLTVDGFLAQPCLCVP
jgi:hypothetical protein